MRRNSTSFSATAKVNSKKKSRRTEFTRRGADDTQEPTTALIETLMNDPVKRAMVMQLINSEKEAIEEYKRQERLKQMQVECPSPAEKLKRKYVMESPVALMRRRALQERERSDAGSSFSGSTTPSPAPSPTPSSAPSPAPSSAPSSVPSPASSPVPTPAVAFEKLLEKIVVFVEVKSGNKDKSEGVKALLKSMGATVVDEFTKDVTHVIFKDGSFLTYQRAKLMKKHLVSVLWLETIRTTGRHVPECNYPALGSSNYDNISLICEKLQNEYMDVVKDEMRRNLSSNDDLSQRNLSSQQNKIALLSQLGNFKNSTFSEDLIPNSQDLQVRSFTSNRLRVRTPDSLVLEESDADSDCGVVNGHSYRRLQNFSTDSEKLSSSSGSSKPSEPDKTIVKRLYLDDVDVKKIKPNKSRMDRKVRNSSTQINKTKEIVNTLAPTAIESNSTPDSYNENVNVRKSKLKINDISFAQLNITGNEKEEESSENVIISSAESSKSKDLQKNIEMKEKKRRTLFNIDDYIESFNESGEEDKITTKNTRRTLFNPVEAHKNLELFSEENEKGKLKKNTRSSLKMQSVKKNKRLSLHPLQSLQKGDDGSSSTTSEASLDLVSKTGEEALLNNKNSCTAGNQGSASTENIVSPILESDSSKRKESLDSVGTNIVGEQDVFVTRRKPRKSRVSLDKDGFKIPDKFGNLSVLTDDVPSIENSSTEEVAQTNKLYTSTEGQLPSLQMPDQFGSKDSITSVDMSPRILPTPGSTSTHSANGKTSFSPLEKINNSNLVSKLINHLESSNTSNESLNVSTKTVRGQRKTKLHKDNVGNVKGDNVLDESRKVNVMPAGVEQGISEKEISSGKENLIAKEKATPTKKRRRKLYNPNDSPTSLEQKIIEEAETDELARKAIEKPSSIPSVPILLTERTKKLIENKLHSIFTSSSEDEEEVIREILKSSERRPTIKKNKKEEVHVDPNLDEQRDLMDELVRRKVCPRQTRSQKKRDDSLLIKPPTETVTPTKMSFKGTSKPPSIVCTRFHRYEVRAFQEIVKTLGLFDVETNVTDRTTHLVVAEPNRTINILRAIARGIWVLRSEWLYSSSKNGKWLPEEDFELINFSPAVQQCRIERQTFGSKYSMDVFVNCGPIYVARSTNPKYTDLEELIALGKGTVVKNRRSAAVCVGEVLRYENTICIGVTWVLDSIQYNVCQNFENYVLRM